MFWCTVIISDTVQSLSVIILIQCGVTMCVFTFRDNNTIAAAQAAVIGS